jgi:hypothetical protein
MTGRTVHSWQSAEGQATDEERRWARRVPIFDFGGWHHVELAPEGGLLAIVNYHELLRLDRESKLLWAADLSAHHDVDVTPDGRIFVLTAERRDLAQGPGRKLPVLDDQLMVLSADGKVRRRLSLLDVLRRSPGTARLMKRRLALAASLYDVSLAHYQQQAMEHLEKHQALEVAAAMKAVIEGRFEGSRRVELMLLTLMSQTNLLHANTVEVLRRDVPGLGRRGNVLLSFRQLDLVAVLDMERRRVIWSWGPGVLEGQHQPSVLDNGHLLIFDNGTRSRRSRVIELDPRTKKIVWSYVGRPPGSFYSQIRGGAQGLPNGNVLITDSESGRALEVTREGQVVWGFFNPDTDDPYLARERAPIYRMTRVPLDKRWNSEEP